MRSGRFQFIAAAACLLLSSLCGCYFEPQPKSYPTERALEMPGNQTQVWAVAPTVNLSGHREVDPILQSDLLFIELQHVHGMTAIPVNRVAQVYAGLNIRQVETPRQAALVCDLLQADALLVPTVTAYDPYSPPKMGASLALFRRPKGYTRPAAADMDELARQLDAGEAADLRQSVGIFDSADGSVRADMQKFAIGRSDPNGPMAEREFFLSMDSYCGFVYHQLIAGLLGVPAEPLDIDGRDRRSHKTASSEDDSQIDR